MKNFIGIQISDGHYNQIYLNNIFGNGYNAVVSEKRNIWNSSELIEYYYNGSYHKSYLGNYWDNFSKVDSNNDGVCDIPYGINENNIDYYPLMNQRKYYDHE